MCDGCKDRILQPIGEDVKVFEIELDPFSGALTAGKSIFGAIPIPCFFRGTETTTEILGIELMERIDTGGTLVKLATKFIFLGYNGFSVSAGDAYVPTNVTEGANPLLAIEKLTTLEYEEFGTLVALGFKQARPGTFVKNTKVFSASETDKNTTAWLHILANASGTFSASAGGFRIRVKYRRYDNC